MFVNGNYHGVGRLQYSDGSYFYSNFRHGKKFGKILAYDNKNHNWIYYEQYDDENEINFLKEGK